MPLALRGDANRGPGFSENLAQHERQDAAVLVVVHLDRRVDAQQQRDFLHAAVGSPDHERRVLLRPDLPLDAADVDGFFTGDAQRPDRVAAFELERQHAIPTRLERWMRSKLRTITARTPRSNVPFAAQSRELPVPYSSPPNTTVGTPSAVYFIAAS